MSGLYDWPEKYGDPTWFLHNRFGMFIHWGLYSLKAKDEWIMTQDKISKTEYDMYLQQFNPDLVKPEKWVKQAKKSGMKYIVFTTKHHEGFALWDSEYTDCKITNTAYGKDLLREFVEACRQEGMKIGFYHSVIDWSHEHFTIDGLHPQREDENARNEQRDMSIYQQYLFDQVEELVTRYGKIDYFWFDFSYGDRDWGWSKGKGPDDWKSEDLEQLILTHQPHILLNNRLGLDRGVYTPEQYQPAEPLYTPEGAKRIWEACQTLNGTWCYNPNNLHWKSSEMLIKLLIDTVSNDGNLLLNCGPTARGNFDTRTLEVLEEIEGWINFHSEAIYGAGSSSFECPQDCRLTQKGEKVFIHIFSWPFRTIHLKNFSQKVKYARFLHDYSEIPVKTFEESDVFHHDIPVIGNNETVLELPVIKPDHVVPVIELSLE
ncbi:alpha-L-fucosidase [Pseudalkalibacillus sp. A8]|uniref:alpha-L-fucosidase n=1 Tax=Pseudalkalibacillus sp. A8 TaxID=3382641 RepID=UPI0038B6B04D